MVPAKAGLDGRADIRKEFCEREHHGNPVQRNYLTYFVVYGVN